MTGTRPRARRRFGQHFLERAWIDKVIGAIAPQSSETFLEIGPGPGGLTLPLADAARRVVGVEIDRDLAADLENLAAPNLAIIEGDFLEVAPSALAGHLFPDGAVSGPVRIAGNLPYNAASPILFRLLDLHEAAAGGSPGPALPGGTATDVSTGPVLRFIDATVMLQREVADRLLAPVGSKDYGVLTILVGRLARVQRLLDLPPGAFRPPPKVRSTVVRLTFHPSNPPVANPPAFTALVRAVFTRRRKTIANALLAYPASATLDIAEVIHCASIDPRRRPETLTCADFARLDGEIGSRLRAPGSGQ